MKGNKSKIIDGKALSEQIQKEVARQIHELKISPGLAVILVGDDKASKLYVSLKHKAANKCGIFFSVYEFPKNSTQDEIIETIKWLNNDEQIDAILVQLPLPKHLDEEKIINTVDPNKDVDGMHSENIKKIINNEKTLITPGLQLGIMQLLFSTKENLSDKNALIIANSPEFTSTLAHYLQEFNIKTEVINPSNREVKERTKQADIIVVAVGKPNWIKEEDIKKGVIIIDVGINQIDKETTVGDVDLDDCLSKAGWITPVPGGVGPMTVAMLLKNTVALAAQKNN